MFRSSERVQFVEFMLDDAGSPFIRIEGHRRLLLLKSLMVAQSI